MLRKPNFKEKRELVKIFKNIAEGCVKDDLSKENYAHFASLPPYIQRVVILEWMKLGKFYFKE